MAPDWDLRWPFEGKKSWAQSVYLPRGVAQGLQRSVHRSQLQPARSSILRLCVKSQGSPDIEINDYHDDRLKLSFTGGTDDPSLEIRFSIVEDPELAATAQSIQNNLGFKFSFFDSHPQQSKYPDRKPVASLPQQDVDLGAIGPAPPGPTNFTDELYDLRWQDYSMSDPKNAERVVTISWKSKSQTSLNLSQIMNIPAPDLVVARRVCGIASGVEGSERQITVDVKWFPALEYKYRNILASPTGLVKYWRYRILRDGNLGSVPVDLCTRYPRDSEEFHEMEALRESDWDIGRTKPICAIGDIDGKTAVLRSKRAFMSSAQAEFYLKGAFLYEEHFVSELRKAHLDTLAREDQYLYRKVGGNSSSDNQWLVFLTKNIMFFQEDAKLPEPGCQATIIWKDSFKELDYTWNGEVVGIEPGIGTEYNIAFLILQPPSHPSIDTLAEHGYRAFFKFSDRPQYCQYILDSMDGVLFPTSSPLTMNSVRPRIRAIMMGRDGNQPIHEKRMDVANDSFVELARDRMNAEQKEAFDELFKSIFIIVISPTGCGKSMLASTFCAACVKSQEREGGVSVLVLTSSRDDLRQMHDLSISAANDLAVSQELTSGMVIIDPISSNDLEWLSEILMKPWGDLRNGLKEVPQLLLDNVLPSAGYPRWTTAVFATVESFSNGLLQAFRPRALIIDSAECIPDHIVFAACGAFASTLERVALFAHEDGLVSLVTTGERNHLRRQLEQTTVARLMKTGIKPMRLDTQYHADPDISAFFRSHAYNVAVNASRENWTLCDAPSARNFATHLFMVNWVAGFLSKSPAECKVSVFVNVKDGQCVQIKSTNALLNLQNLLTISKIIKSLPPAGIALSGILLLTFFPRSVALIRSFLKSQGLQKVRVEHIDSPHLNPSETAVAIIDLPTIYTNNATKGGSLGDVKRNKKALLLPSGLRIVVGHADIGLRGSGNEYGNGEGIGQNQGGRFWQAFVKQHRDFEMVKDVVVGEELLEFEDVLCPERYWMASKRGVDATGMFRELKEKKVAREEEENDQASSGLADGDAILTYRLEDRLENMTLGPDGKLLPDSVLVPPATWREVVKERDATGYTYSTRPNEKYGKDREKLDRIKKSSSWR